MREKGEPGCENRSVPPTPAQQARAARIAAGLRATGFALPRHPHRADDPPRAPRLPLPRRPAPPARPLPPVDPQTGGKTVTRILTDGQLADYQPWFDNQRRLRALVAELETLSQEIAYYSPHWDR